MWDIIYLCIEGKKYRKKSMAVVWNFKRHSLHICRSFSHFICDCTLLLIVSHHLSHYFKYICIDCSKWNLLHLLLVLTDMATWPITNQEHAIGGYLILVSSWRSICLLGELVLVYEWSHRSILNGNFTSFKQTKHFTSLMHLYLGCHMCVAENKTSHVA